jgi:outer membrane protein OmpA-like peptidoglycan-associated protein
VCAQVTVTNERSINTAFQEYSPAFFKNDLVFIATNPVAGKNKNEDATVGKYTTSIFWSKRSTDGSLQRPMPFAEELTTKFYDGPLSFNTSGDIIFFTRTNLKGGKPKQGKDGKVHLKIYTAEYQSDKQKWSDAKELPFCSSDFDCLHPSVSSDGKRLYFASNRPGSLGGMDLFVSFWQQDKWGEPVNLGPKVNTVKDEFFPHIHADGTLFFATNGRKAYGGLDIFAIKKTAEAWLEPVALPEPINSASDDFGIIVNENKKMGFFSSNRASGQGDDDIFRFTVPNSLDMPQPERMDEELAAEAVDTKEERLHTETQLAERAAKIKAEPKTEPAKNANKPAQSVENTVKQTDIAAEQKTNNTQTAKQSPKTEEPKTLNAVKKADEKVVTVPKKVTDTKTAAVPKSTDKPTVSVEDKRLDIEICSFEKAANKPLSDVKVQILNLKLVNKASILTDSLGKVRGFRHESGEEVGLDALPKQYDITDEKGNAKIALVQGERYLFNFSKDGYEPRYVVKTVFPADKKVAAFMVKLGQNTSLINPNSLHYKPQVQKEPTNTRGAYQESVHEMPAEKPILEVPIEQAFVQVTEGYMFELRGIYYGYGDAEVNIEAQSELQPLLNMMRKNPAIEIEVASHTDSRGKDQFNRHLSQLRAENIKTYFVENGIEPRRIIATGYGETKLRNHCKDAVNCTEEEHALNRRTEIRVLKGIEPQRIVEESRDRARGMEVRKVYTEGGQEQGAEFIAGTGDAATLAATPYKSKSRYFVIIGTFTKPENALKHQRKAIDAGFVEAEIIQYQETMLYGVSVRQFLNEKEARKLTDYINQQKQFEAFIKELK